MIPKIIRLEPALVQKVLEFSSPNCSRVAGGPTAPSPGGVATIVLGVLPARTALAGSMAIGLSLRYPRRRKSGQWASAAVLM